jgi:CHAT domain-containing protein/Tfp pilus assembly protein PilF
MKIIPNDRCLNDQDFYEYLAGKKEERDPGIQAHLSTCSSCRQGLAELIRILDESSSEPVEDPQPQEIQETLTLIHNASHPASRNKLFYRWGSIAAAAVVAIGLSSTGFLLYVRYKSQSYCNQAQAFLQQVYQARSPNDLRLDLPFQSEATQRADSNKNEALDGAERLFNQALGVREGMSQARLGLGYLDLQKHQFRKAESEFQKVLESKPSDPQALLGRGVSRFEEGLTSTDPIARKNYLDKALADFEEALTLNPESSEARYNKIQVFYNTGRHKEALREIDAYLSRDSNSIWAAKLKELRTRIQMNSYDALMKEVKRAALTRNAQSLETFVRLAPGKIATSVITLFRNALAAEGRPAMDGTPDSASIEWAARFMAQAYQQATGDNSCTHLIRFYAGLSPPQRKTKQKLDARLEQLIGLYDKNNFQSAISQSESLIRDFKAIGDYWQLVRTYQLRGSCWYMGKTNYAAANREYREMLRHAELSGHSELIARSLQSVANAYAGMGQYENQFACLSKLEKMAQSSQMNYLNLYIYSVLGYSYFEFNQLDISLRHFLSCLTLSYRLMDSHQLIFSLEKLGSIMERMGRFADAKKYYEECAVWLKAALDDGLQRANSEADMQLLAIQNRLGNLALRMHDFKTAEAIFIETLQGRTNRLRDLEARNRIGLCRAFFEQKKFAQANVETDRVLDLAIKNSYQEIEWQANNLKGMLLEQDGKHDEALGYYTRSTQIIEKLRTAITASDLRQSYFSQRFDPYRKIVALLFHSKKNPDLALSYADNTKSMTLRETLRLQDSTGARRKSSSDLLLELPPRTFILEYFFGVNETFAFITSASGTDAISVPISQTELQTLVSTYLESIASNNSPSFDSLSRKLYGILIEPILSKKQLEPADNLAILPDGPLHLLPFSSLLDKNERFLLEKYAISYAPSSSILQYCLDRHKNGRIDRQSSILFLDGGSDLKGAGREFTSLLSFYPNNKFLSNPDVIASGASFDQYEIIHFSGHAQLRMNRPQLLFHTSAGEKYLESQTIHTWNLKKNRLVVLAGCNTGIGPIFDGETPWGLIPSFLKAGAPSLLVSLLPVDDLTTATLTSRFYESLASGFSKAQALRSAQKSLLNAETRKRPASWVPFVLVGDPR